MSFIYPRRCEHRWAYVFEFDGGWAELRQARLEAEKRGRDYDYRYCTKCTKRELDPPGNHPG